MLLSYFKNLKNRKNFTFNKNNIKKEIDNAFDFYIRQYRQKQKCMDILIKKGLSKPNIEYYNLPYDIEKLETKDLKFLFKLMLSEDKKKQNLLDDKIQSLENDIKDTLEAMKRPDLYKTENESMEEFIKKGIELIEKYNTYILRLKAGDFRLCEELIKNERYCGTFLYDD